jgi:tetratricopeptide (TPR) repeat protein
MGARLLWVTLGAAAALWAQEGEPEVYGVRGKAYFALEDKDREAQKADLELALEPRNPIKMLAAARVRDKYLKFAESIMIYSRGVDEFPDDVRFLRYRGHRFISTRRLDLAVLDLKRAAEMAPASFDVSYHLALAYYLRGDHNHAAREYQRCLAMGAKPQPDYLRGMPEGWRSCYAMDDDTRVAVTEWAWRALRRAGKAEEAGKLLESIRAGMNVKENGSYYRTLQLYKGLATLEQTMTPPMDGNAAPTIGYGVGLWHWLHGRKAEACAAWEKVLESPHWSAFGFIAAESDLARGYCPVGKKKK